MRAKYAHKEVARMRAFRSELESQLIGKPHVLGTMLGLKEAAGETTAQLSLVVFVSEKVDTASLGKQQKIPATLSAGGKAFVTDVQRYTSLMLQADPFPAGALTTNDGTEYGTMTSFARTKTEIYGLTCAHAIEGTDNNPYSQSPVAVWSPALKKFIMVGSSAMALAGGGAGVPGAFGFSDAALFTIVDPNLRKRAIQGTQIPVAAAKFGERVYGSATSGAKTGTVVGIEKQVGNELADLVIDVDFPGTLRGDSGMLWRNANGHAIGIHAKGDGGAPGSGSKRTAAMGVGRAVSGLQIALINP